MGILEPVAELERLVGIGASGVDRARGEPLTLSVRRKPEVGVILKLHGSEKALAIVGSRGYLEICERR